MASRTMSWTNGSGQSRRCKTRSAGSGSGRTGWKPTEARRGLWPTGGGKEVVELRERVGQAEGESGALREQVKAERGRADQAEARAGRAEAERDAARAEREAAKVAAAAAEGEAKAVRLTLEEARRPFWRRWLGP